MTEYKWSPEGLSQALKDMHNECSEIDINTLKLKPNKLVLGLGIETGTFKTKSGRMFEVKYEIRVSEHPLNKNSVTETPETKKIVSGDIISLIEI